MLKEMKDKWVAGLRSGDFIQICGKYKNFLNPIECCAMGVLREVMDMSQSDITSVTRKAELSMQQYYEIVDMNDKQGKTFAEIADYIEVNL